jgi:hypothetical protein
VVDGFAVINYKPTVFESSGCWYHGCKDCFPDDNTPLHNDPSDTMAFRRERTEAKNEMLKYLGYNVVHEYQCKFEEILKNDPEMRNYIENHPIVKVDPLNVRDCLYGGRCNGLKLYHECDEGEEIHYVDFLSLYPDRCKYFKIPVGHPIVHLEPRIPDIFTTEGILKCTVLPPQNLYHPVLPSKMNGKLMFVLCRTCGEEMNEGECNHSETERELSGVWVVDEVRRAVELGYKVRRIFEFWEYKVKQYDPNTKSGGVFSGYIDLFLKIKQESSGWPENCIDEDTKSAYIESFHQKEGILLDRNKIASNSGLRFVAKALLNSLWGRFALNQQRTQTEIIRDPNRLFQLLMNPNIAVSSLNFIGDEIVVANFETHAEAQYPDPTVNVVIAAYVTTGARLKLYECLHKLQEAAFYFDTDSIIYLQKSGDTKLPIGNNLGDLTNELASYGENAYIKKLICAGPKHYGMEIVNESGEIVKTTIKVRGITLNYRNSQIVNFEAMKELILEDGEPKYVENPRKIRRSRKFGIVSKPENKIYRAVYTKRKRVPNSYNTLPFGYK